MVTLPGVTHHRARVNGVELHYVEQGSGPLLLLLHGFPEFWWSWRAQIGPWSQHFRVVAADMRGYNESEKPATGYDCATLAADVAGLIDHLGGGPCRLVGHDWGGIIAYQVAMDFPAKVQRLGILNAPHPDAWIKGWLEHPEQQRKAYYVFFNLLPDLPEELYRKAFATGTVRLAKAMAPEEVAVYRDAFEKPGAATATVNYYRELSRDTARRRHLKPKRITCPVRVLWGARDIALEPVMNDYASTWIDQMEVTYFPDSFHWIQKEQAEAVTHMMLEFLRRP